MIETPVAHAGRHNICTLSVNRARWQSHRSFPLAFHHTLGYHSLTTYRPSAFLRRIR